MTQTAQLIVNDGGYNGGDAVITRSATVTDAGQATLRLCDFELTLGYQGNTAISGSVAAIRGNTTILNGTLITPSGYVYGTQGKITIQGTINVTTQADACAAIVGQLDLSAAQALTAGYVTCGWFDCGASCAVAGPLTTVNVIKLTNTTTKLVNALIMGVADASYFADLTDLGYGGPHWLFPSTAASSLVGSIAVKINGTGMFLPLYTSN
jgi:hypothetical protein